MATESNKPTTKLGDRDPYEYLDNVVIDLVALLVSELGVNPNLIFRSMFVREFDPFSDSDSNEVSTQQRSKSYRIFLDQLNMFKRVFGPVGVQALIVPIINGVKAYTVSAWGYELKNQFGKILTTKTLDVPKIVEAPVRNILLPILALSKAIEKNDKQAAQRVTKLFIEYLLIVHGFYLVDSIPFSQIAKPLQLSDKLDNFLGPTLKYRSFRIVCR